MDELPELDLSQYSRLPNIDVAMTITLLERLQALAPQRPAAPLKATLLGLRAAGAELKGAFDAALAADPGTSKRPIDLDSDTAWWCLDLRLETAAALPVRLQPKAPRAAELRARLFPQGRRFLTLEYSAQWAEMDARMRLIEREKLRPDLEALCGAPVVQFLYETHEKYRAMIGARPGAAPGKGAPPNLAAPLARARKAISGHFVQLLAAYQASGPKVKAQLLPAFQLLDEVRDKALQGMASPPAKGDGDGDGDKKDAGGAKDPAAPPPAPAGPPA